MKQKERPAEYAQQGQQGQVLLAALFMADK